MRPYFEDDWVTIHNGDCIDVMRGMEPGSIDAIVTDPPYGLSFMGREWDYGVPGEPFWAEALRVAKPGAHLLAFGGTRTFHRLACAIEDAGWEIRDCLGWLHSQGFPKSLNVSKAIDKEAGLDRPRVAGGCGSAGSIATVGLKPGEARSDEPLTAAAAAWQGYGTALKPAWEPIILARKPLTTTVAGNVQRWGTGAINIDGCRVGYASDEDMAAAAAAAAMRLLADQNANRNAYGDFNNGAASLQPYLDKQSLGRWPANIVHDGSDEVLAVFPQTSSGSRAAGVRSGMGYHGANGDGGPAIEGSSGSAARFFAEFPYTEEDRRVFYTGKASSAEREGYLTCDCETVKLDAWVREVQSHSEQTVCTSPRRDISEATSEDAYGSSTSPCGNSTTAQSRQDSMFTTSTATSRTTASRTSNSSASASTSGSTAAASCETASGTSPAESADQCSPSMPSTGISPQRAGRSTGVVVPVTSPLWSGTRRCAVCGSTVRKVAHPTQKPLDLMRWLVRLVTPPDGVVLDPFMGSGTTLKAARAEGHRSIGIDLEREHCEIAWGRLSQGVLL